jgi:putative Ca2+/H+ antiporter (TMEM165/GDT1 family)
VQTPPDSTNVTDATVPHSTVPDSPELPDTSGDRRFDAEIKIFLSTFVTILLAELGDKTQLTTLLISAESQSPWIVFLGAGSALVTTSLLGVLVGRWIATRVSAETLETIVGGLLMGIALLLLWDVVHL